MKRISTSNISDKLIRFWWVLLIGGIFGGLITYFISIIFLQPVYLSEAKMSIAINFKEVGQLSQYEQDQMIGNIVSLFSTEETIKETINSLDDSNMNINDFLNTCFLERQVNSILFRCKSTNQDSSQKWANNWARVSYEKLSETFKHSIEYEKLRKLQTAFELCLIRSIIVPPTSGDCLQLLPESKNNQEMSELLDQEFQLSKNIYPGFVFSDIIPAEYPIKATRFQTNSILLIGSFLGFILACIFLLLNKYEKN
jgi:capsular polysaccharide biosynthesis protein